MKISQEEIDAANFALGELMEAPLDEAVMEHALISALKVRRARKHAKRERQSKEKDNTIQKLAADMMTWCGKTLPEMTTDELVSARDELAGFESMSLRENGFYHRMNAEITERKEKDKQVVESVTGIPIERGMNEAERADFERKTVEMMRDLSTPSKAPEWDGTFGVGEWEMRNGEKAIIQAVFPTELSGTVNGYANTWPRPGRYLYQSQMDLIRPWPKGEQ